MGKLVYGPLVRAWVFSCSCLAALLVAGGCSSDPTPDETSIDAGSSPDSGGPDVHREDGGACGTGTQLCGARCYDLQVDPAHCGACDHACGDGEVCSAGTCAISCGPGLTKCEASAGGDAGTKDAGGDAGLAGSYCANTKADNGNCGACGHACKAGEVCGDGACVATCTGALVGCRGACIDPTTDRFFCGAKGDCAGKNAGDTCDTSEGCAAGKCVSNNTALASLTFSSGTLSPAFTSETVLYVLSGASALTNLVATATAADLGATITINGSPVISGTASLPIARPYNTTTVIPVEVTAAGGATRVYQIVLVASAQSTFIKAADAMSGDYFGAHLAVSGDTLVVGAPYESSVFGGIDAEDDDVSAPGAGAVYVFVRSGDTWTQQAYIKAPSPAQNDNFGASVAISGDTLVVGAPYEGTDANGDRLDETSETGTVYVYTRSGTTWTQEARLKATVLDLADHFGTVVAVAGNTLAVSAPGEDSGSAGVNGDELSNMATDSGAVYVYTRSGTTWTKQAYLKASNPAENDGFGFGLSLSGDTIAVGAPFEDSNATGVGGDQTNDALTDSGAVYLFTRTGSAWTQNAYIKSSNTGEADLFGLVVALAGDTLAVSAPTEDSKARGVGGDQGDNSSGDSGAVYVFSRSGSVWSQEAYLKASNTGDGDQFGAAISLSGDLLAVGAPWEDSQATGIDGDPADDTYFESGAVYIFARKTGIWSAQSYVKAPNTNIGYAFGGALDVTDGDLTVGSAPESSGATGIGGDMTDVSAPSSGAVYWIH